MLTSHAQVLMCIAHDPGVRLRGIAAGLGITGRSARGIVTGLAESGYVVKQKDGRRNRYQIQAHLPLPESASQELAIGEVMALLIGASPREGPDPAWRHQGSPPSSGTRARTPGVLCDESTQKCERGAERTQHIRAALAPRRAGGRGAAPRRAADGRAGRTAPQLREGGIQVHARRAARAACVSAGRRPSGGCARGAGRSGPLAGGDLTPAARGAHSGRRIYGRPVRA